MKWSKRCSTHPVQQVCRRRPGARQVLNQEVGPVVELLLDGCRQNNALSTYFAK